MDPGPVFFPVNSDTIRIDPRYSPESLHIVIGHVLGITVIDCMRYKPQRGPMPLLRYRENILSDDPDLV